MSGTQLSDLNGLAETPTSKQNPPSPPPSTKRWTWEYVSTDDGKDRRRQTTPELDAELLLSQGRRTRRMAKAANGGVNTPAQQTPTIPQPKAGKKRKAPTPSEDSVDDDDDDDDDDDVIHESVRIAKQRKLRHEESKPEQQARQTTKAKAKSARVPKRKKIHRVIKPKAKAARVPRQNKAHKDTKPNPNVVRACALARAGRIQKAKRPVRIAQSAVREIEPSVDNRQEQPDPAYEYNTEPERRHGIMLKKEFYDPFRQAFSLNFIWPNFSSDNVQNALNREREVQSTRKFTVYDILPKDRQGMLERMAQRGPAAPQNEALVNQGHDEEAQVHLSAAHTATPITEDSWEDATNYTVPNSEQLETRASSLEILGTLSQEGVAGHAPEVDMTGATTHQNRDIFGPKRGESESEDEIKTNNNLVLERAKRERVLIAEIEKQKSSLLANGCQARSQGQEGKQDMAGVQLPNGHQARSQGHEVKQDMVGVQLPIGHQARSQGHEVKQDMAETHAYGSTDDDTPNSDELDSRASWGPEMDEDDDGGDSCWEREEEGDDEGDETDEEDYRSGRFVLQPQVNGF